MRIYKPTKGPPSVALILNPNFYSYGQFIGTHFVAPIQRKVKDFGKQLVSISAFQLNNGKKPTKAQLGPHIEELVEYCETNGIHTVICTNAQYFEVLTKEKFMASVGAVKKCVLSEEFVVIPVLSPAIISQYPNKKSVVDKGIRTVAAYLSGEYSDTVAKVEDYKFLIKPKEIKEELDRLKEYPMLAWDIETTGLVHNNDSIITLALSHNEGTARTIVIHEKYTKEDHTEIAHTVRKFFREYKGKLLIHNIGFEGKFYAFNFFMNSWNDYENMYKAVNEMRFEDSMLLAKAARNSVDRTSFTLKELAADKYGNWDKDINVKKALEEPIEKMAYYNAIDVCATWHVWDTINKEILPEQKKFYDTYMRDVQKLFLKIMLTGMPIDRDRAIEVKEQLERELRKVETVFYTNKYVIEAEKMLRVLLAEKYNKTTKVKKKTPKDFKDTRLNHSSVTQKRLLLLDVMEYEPIDFSADTGDPKVDKAFISEMLGFEQDKERRQVLECLKSFSEISIIISTFLNTFINKSIEVAPGEYRLYGNLVTAGAVSFRPTSNSPNLLNMPSGSEYGALIKTIFKARKGYIIAQADYAALQNRTGAFITGAKNLIRLLNDKIDGHIFHASYFYRDQFPDYEDDVKWYAEAKSKYKDLRTKAKAPAFALQFGCGVQKLQKLIKGKPGEADRIFSIYHNELYPEIHEHNNKIGLVAKTKHYIPLGLGWGVYTHSAASKSNKIASAAQRSAANATTQFWDILTLLALIDFQKKVEEHGYTGKVILHATIYDSCYFEVVDDPEVILWVNKNLISCMKGAIKYMEKELGRKSPVDLPADLELGKTWKAEGELSNDCTKEDVIETLQTIKEHYDI